MFKVTAPPKGKKEILPDVHFWLVANEEGTEVFLKASIGYSPLEWHILNISKEGVLRNACADDLLKDAGIACDRTRIKDCT